MSWDIPISLKQTLSWSPKQDCDLCHPGCVLSQILWLLTQTKSLWVSVITSWWKKGHLQKLRPQSFSYGEAGGAWGWCREWVMDTRAGCCRDPRRAGAWGDLCEASSFSSVCGSMMPGLSWGFREKGSYWSLTTTCSESNASTSPVKPLKIRGF